MWVERNGGQTVGGTKENSVIYAVINRQNHSIGVRREGIPSRVNAQVCYEFFKSAPKILWHAQL